MKNNQKTTMIAPIVSLFDLRRKAMDNPQYGKLAIISAQNLGGMVTTVDQALRHLNIEANETSEEGVIDEINFCRDCL